MWRPLLLAAIGLPLLLACSDEQVGKLQQDASAAIGVAGAKLQQASAPLAEIKQLVPPRPLITDFVWEGNLDTKLDMERNEDETDEFKLKGDSRISHGHWRHVLKGEYEHETKNSQKVDNNWELEYDLDRFITQQWFIRSSVYEKHDEFEDINRQTSYGMGPGYRFWDDELGRFELIGQYERFQLRGNGQNTQFDAYGLEWDYKRLLSGTRFELYSTAQMALPLIDQVDYVFEGEAGVRYRVNEQGRVENPEAEPDCHPLFVRPSLTAAKTFRYQPRIVAGQAVAVVGVKNTFHYRIE